METRSVAVMIGLLLVFVAGAPAHGGAPEPALPLDLPEGWYARIETSKGRIVARLLPEQAPQAVAHFAALAEARLEWTDPATGESRKNHFYDGTRVHRAEAGIRFEAGSPTGTGRGGPEIWVPFEEKNGPIGFNAGGRLGMTRAPGRRVSGYQFFVTATAQPFMTGGYPCFGVVVSGLDVVMDITSVKTYSNGRPMEPVIIEEIRIFSRGDPRPLPEPRKHQPEPAQLQLMRKPREE
jgi:cyclophilin family peptidyl-prolyl cis-trans isomerase